MRGDAEDGGLAFQDLEPVGGDQDGFRRLVHAVVGTADPLQQPGNALWCADLLPRLLSDLMAGAIYLTAALVVLNSVLGLELKGLLATSGLIATVPKVCTLATSSWVSQRARSKSWMVLL